MFPTHCKHLRHRTHLYIPIMSSNVIGKPAELQGNYFMRSHLEHTTIRPACPAPSPQPHKQETMPRHFMKCQFAGDQAFSVVVLNRSA